MKKILQGEKEKMSKLNLYIKYLAPYVAEQHLYEAFSKSRTVTSAEVERYPDGTSKRVGYVAFISEEEKMSGRTCTKPHLWDFNCM